MELLYALHKKQSGVNTDSNYNPGTLCSISTCNIVAFTTCTEVTEPYSYGFHCYVADINTPWFIFKVTSNRYPISVLEWDILGKYLLIADTFGNVQIWIQKDNMISEWCQLHLVNFPGEHIIKAVFFHNGRKISLTSDKKDLLPYMEKFQRVKFSPSVRQFGGVPAEGCLVISSTGLLGAFLLPTEPGQITQGSGHLQTQSQNQPNVLPSVTESLGLTRNFYTTADICYSKNGHFLVAVANGECKNHQSVMVQCFRVSVKKIDDKITITSNSLRSFFLNEGSGRDLTDLKICKLKWASHEDSDSLIVTANCIQGCSIELWNLVEKSTPIHKLFQSNKSEVFKTFVWANQAHFRYTAKVINICTSKLQLGTASYITLAMADNTIHCLHRETLKRVANASLSFGWRNDSTDSHSSKQMRVGSPIAAIDLSWMGHLLTAIDNQGQLFAFKMSPNFQDQTGMAMSIMNIVTLLEYCMVTGYDYLDILLTIKVNALDSIVERLSENFNRQTPAVQQYYYVNFLTMKTNLFRISLSGQSKAHDLTSLLMLHSILIAFKSLLRPADLTSHDKGPAENLAMGLSESNADVDKVLLNLEGKDFTVEPSTLQSLQQLIQWVADLALNILAKLPENRSLMGSIKNVGYDISKDIVALNSIRELLVMIRIWGLLKEQCLPVFSRSADNLDILSTLFRLLTRLALNPNEPDELLLDECCLLPSQVLIPQLQFNSQRTCIASPILSHINLPIHLDYNVEPECLKFYPDLPTVEGGLSGDNIVDSVRHLQLGKRPPSLRRCCRCGACSNVWSVARTAAMKAWEQRWANGCRCGGFWRLQTLI